jgi:hypothetical protein
MGREDLRSFLESREETAVIQIRELMKGSALSNPLESWESRLPAYGETPR